MVSRENSSPAKLVSALQIAIGAMTFSGLPSAVYSVEFPSDRRHTERAAAAPEGDDKVVPYEQARRRAMLRFDREYLQELLRCCNGNVTAAAKMSGLSRTYLHRLLRRQRLRGRGPFAAEAARG